MSSKLRKEAEAFQKIHPKEYLKKFISKDLRTDGRSFDELRAFQITPSTISTANGSSIVKLGETIVVCGIKAEIAEPTFEEPESGFLVPNIEMGPLCSAKIRGGPPTERPMVYSEILRKVLSEGEIFDRKQLCIQPEVAVWCLYIDLICLSDSGNVLDAAIFALSNALANTTLPQAEFDEEAGLVKADPSVSSLITTESDIFSLTFSILEGDVMLADPNTEEEELADGSLTLILRGSDGNLVYTFKTGRASLTPDTIDKCLSLAQNRLSTMKSQ